MSREHVTHKDIVQFAEERVNLKRDDALELRRQANMLRDRLQTYLAEHPDFELRKMLLSGSLAKGTALKSVSDIDVACYVSSDTAPHKVSDLIAWLASRLEKAFPNFKPEQIQRKTYSVAVNFITTGNEVDIVPILYRGDPQWKGSLISQDTGEELMTSVPMHLGFLRKRKDANKTHFAQVVRLIKFWAKLQKQADENFRFKSFMTELIVAHLADNGMALNDYPTALSRFFNFLACDGLKSTITFSDYYKTSDCKATSDPIRIWDPVNCENNVAKLYKESNRDLLIEAALDAGDAVEAALRATTKGETVRYWQKSSGRHSQPKEAAVWVAIPSPQQSHSRHVTARYIASKVATDLKRLQGLYLSSDPSDAAIDAYEEELTYLLKHDAVSTVVYGYKRNGVWTAACVRYTVAADGSIETDDDPGKIRPGHDIAGAKFTSFLSYSSSWWQKGLAERERIETGSPLNRSNGTAPSLERGYWSDDRSYSAGGRGVSRSTVKGN